MRYWTRIVLVVGALVWGAGSALALDPENALYMDLAFGRVVISLQPNVAPKTCEQIKRLVRAGFYNGLVFHRVIDGFMAQTGDPTGTGAGGSGHPLRPEFSNEPFTRGVVAMARAGAINDPNDSSADSQFFIMYAAAPGLDGKYTIFGHVESGMEFIDRLRKGDRGNNGMVTNPDKIIKMQVMADAIAADDKAKQPKPKPPDDNTGEPPKR